MRSPLSRRGRALLEHAPLPPYLDSHFERRDDPEYVGLCISENKTVWDLLRPRLTAARTDLPHQAICYDEMIGSLAFRKQLSFFMGRTFLGREFDPKHIAVLAGAGSVLEMLFHNIADEGDAVLVPTPSYAGFWADLETRNQLTIVPVPTTSDTGFALTERLLDQAFEASERPVRALLYTNPDNPTGAVASPDEIEMVIGWTRARGIHLVFDEVYALSVFGEARFVSGAQLLSSLGDTVHIVWAFSKDFGSSGLRCGVLVSENAELMQSIEALGYWSLVSGDTQHVLGEMISDRKWVDGYIETMRLRLKASYDAITTSLDEVGIKWIPAQAGFFFLCDLREFMTDQTWDAEDVLWQRILDEANVNLTPGSACRNAEPGLFRLCFATEPIATVTAGIRRLGDVLEELAG